jgi:pyruvate dehydrogenase E1 component beta subunit
MAVITFRQALHDTLRDEMLRDENVVLMGEEIGVFEGSYKITAGLLQEFGEKRIRDTPIAEEGFVGAAVGAAMLGLRPVVEIMTINFIMLAIDQIVNHAAKIHYMFGGQSRVPLVIRTPGGGGQQLAATHSQNPEVWFAHVPGLKVVAPSTPADVCGMLRTAVEDGDPVLFLEHKKTYRLVTGLVPDDPTWRVPIGLAEVARPGDDLTVVTYGLHRLLCLEAAQVLADEDGTSVEVVDLRTISPIDRDTVLASVARTGRCLVVHEDNVSFGVGAEVAAIVAEHGFWDLDAPVRRLATADVPSYPFAPSLEGELFVDTPKIVAAMRGMLAS